MENRALLKKIIEVIILFGLQNIDFRGHRDDGPINIDTDDDKEDHDEGNFREFLEFSANKDEELYNHLKSKLRTIYVSAIDPNSLTRCCLEIIMSQIIHAV